MQQIDIKETFIEALNIFEKNNNRIDKLIIFENDNDILNLAELISKMSCIISPSTGTIHLASNMFIPTIGLYSKLDTIKWVTRDKCYIVIKKTLNEITIQEENEIIKEVISTLKNRMNNNQIQSKNIKNIL